MDLFSGACAVVTGGASGIGKSLATALAEHGADVAVADIFEDGAKAVATDLGGSARAYRCDVSDPADVEALAASVASDFGRVNFVFANAGVYTAGTLIDTPPDEFRWLFDVNVNGVYNTVTAFAPLLQQQAASGSAARFIMTGSENSVGLPKFGVNTAYTATKHALLGMADGLRRDFREAGEAVGVSILCPGAVNTGIMNSRRVRQSQYGGSVSLEPEDLTVIREIMEAVGQDPDLTARLCLTGVANDEFIIIADPKIRSFAPERHQEVEAALDMTDDRLASMTE